MKKKLFLLTAMFVAINVTSSFAQSSDNEDEVAKIDAQHSRMDFRPGQVLVKFKDGSPVTVAKSKGFFRSVSATAVDAVMKEFGVETMDKLLPNEQAGRKLSKSKAYNGSYVEDHDMSQVYFITTKSQRPDSTMMLAERLEQLDEVEFAEPNYMVYAVSAEETTDSVICAAEDNPLTCQQWGLDAYGVKELWNKPIINKKRPIIAILDTGVDITHPDLANNIWTNEAEANGEEGYDNDNNGFNNDVHGWDFINNTPDMHDFNMHGTHVAGIAAASNNGTGIVGANPQALLMPISVLQSDGTGDVATIVKGIDYAVANGATVLNMSLGTYANSRAMRQALERAYQNAVIVAAAGNDGKCVNSNHHPICYGAAPMFPGAYSFVLGVQATTSGGGLAAFSNYDDDGANTSAVTTLQDPDGFNYELKAPGANILSTIPGGKYKALNGTSMASPLIAGAVSALLMVKEYDSQEILWGDLLHTANIADAYAITDRPAELDIMSIQMRDRKELSEQTEEDYSYDGEIDAGETVSIYPIIRTTFGEASNIKMHLEMGDEFEDTTVVEILTDEVDFGMHLDAYGKGVALNPLKLKVAEGVADNRHIKMKVVVTCDESSMPFENDFTMVVNNMVKISGLISENTTLTADHVYLVNENIGIMEGATLTIEPGTRLEFMEGMGISSFGKLVANGTPEKPIVFTGHNGATWAGVLSHESSNLLEKGNSNILFTNADSTLFTILQTNQTPKQIVTTFYKSFCCSEKNSPEKYFYLTDYITKPNFSHDFTAYQNLLTDPDYITPAVLNLLADFKAYYSQFPTYPTEEAPYYSQVNVNLQHPYYIYGNPRDTISYCKIENFQTEILYAPYPYPYMKDCVICPSQNSPTYYAFSVSGERNNLMDIGGSYNYAQHTRPNELIFSNILNNILGDCRTSLPAYSALNKNNYLNNFAIQTHYSGKYYGRYYSLAYNTPQPNIDKSKNPSYLGTSREDIIRPYIYEIGNAPNTYGSIDLSNMPTRPYAEAHGIVWKVVVNGKDAQDEYEDLAPLGVGRHKFEVYFNRPMNKAVAPQISFGVRDPYTQQVVAEDGSWNEEGTIYTAYKTITGKTKSDGVNRIYVYGAEDNEYFEIPYEKTRFNINVQAAGSMATGFAAEAGLGRVNLTWNNDDNDFEDAMGFNVYRYGEPYQKILPAGWREDGGYYSKADTIMVVDTVRINQSIIDIEDTEYADYDVVPGETYYYYYKVLSTDLQEYDVSNVVAATPQTSAIGDANGDTNVDVSDVITTVNYAAGMDPKPFIFEAADINKDITIDILDVIGIIRGILDPTTISTAVADATATYTIEDGVVYVESPVALAGVQVQLSTNEKRTANREKFSVAEDLKGFEQTSAWLGKNDYLFLGYNLAGKTLPAGKHAILRIGDADIADIRLSDAAGRAVIAEQGDVTGIEKISNEELGNRNERTGNKAVYDLEGRKISNLKSQTSNLKGVYIIDGKKVKK